jgi:serine/threonine protein kinase
MGKVADGPAQPGDVLDGKYRVERRLGSGGMGIVVAARHIKLQTRVALKFLQPSLAKDAESVKRFEREARASVALKGEHAVRILDVGELSGGSPYLVMEYLTGTDLGTLVDQRELFVSEAVSYVLQACEAVAEAHSLGIVHRDLKPGNLFLTEGAAGAPLVKVVDFGLAKMVKLSAKQSSLTHTTDLVGSPAYMSPEQLHDAKEVDRRSDIWSLGVCLYELIERHLPFEGQTVPSVCLNVTSAAPRPFARPDLPPQLAAVILRCLEKDPAARFPDVPSFAAALEPFAGEAMRGATDRILAIAQQGESRSRSVSERPPPPAPRAAVGVDTRTVAIVDSERRREATLRKTAAVSLAIGGASLVVLAIFLLARSFTSSTRAPAAPARIDLPTESAPLAVSAAPSVSAVADAAPASPLPIELSAPIPTTKPSPKTRPVAAPPPVLPRNRGASPADSSRAYP